MVAVIGGWLAWSRWISEGVAGRHGIDGEFPFDQALASGESMTFDVVLVFFHPEGCNDGGTLRVPGRPTVTVEALGRADEVQANADFTFRRTAATPGCD